MAYRYYSTPGTFGFEWPIGIAAVDVLVIGGGGGGAYGIDAFPDGGGGGGGGGCAYYPGLTIGTPGNTYTVIVGSGGLGGDIGVTIGGGTVSSFQHDGGTIVGYGGVYGGTGAGYGTSGGGGGTSGNGIFNYTGGRGGDGGSGTATGGGGGGAADGGGDGAPGSANTPGGPGIASILGSFAGGGGIGGNGPTDAPTVGAIAGGGGGGGYGTADFTYAAGKDGAYGAVYVFWTPPTPSPTSISPIGGSTAGGTPVTITGTDFSGGSTVTFDGVPATSVVVVNSTTITCVTPAHSGQGNITVQVTNEDSVSGSVPDGFTYFAEYPTIATYNYSMRGGFCNG